MHRFRWVCLLLGLVLLLNGTTPAHAQDYSFSLDRHVVDLWIQSDGSVRLEIWLTFTCDRRAHPIDVVDLGLPSYDFDLSGIQADVDGTPIGHVGTDYQGTGSGVALWLGKGTIGPGKSGTVHVTVQRVGGMIYADDADPDYASLEYSPTYFDGAYVHGTTDLTVRFHMPPGTQPEEPRWHRSPEGWPQEQPEAAPDAEGRPTYTWHHATAAPDRMYVLGASFPRKYVPAEAIQGPRPTEYVYVPVHFSLPYEMVDVWVERDGSAQLEYWLTFALEADSGPLNLVDLPLPNADYDLDRIWADVDGKPIGYIQISEKLPAGIGIGLYQAAIQPGQGGTLHVLVERVGRMVYQDRGDDVRVQFSPASFDATSVRGTTALTVRLHLPPGVKPEEARWHRSPEGWPQEKPEVATDEEGRVVLTWSGETAIPSQEYTFGASFPRLYVAEEAIQKGPSLWSTVGEVLLGSLCFLIPVAIIVLLIILGRRAYLRRQMAYLPPSMKVEGVGIKRGLTAVEAAILLQTPLNRVLTMILFGLLKKGALTVLDDDPLTVQVEPTLPEGLRTYETGFLEAVQKNGRLDEGRLRQVVIDLVREVNNKMKGFSRKETIAYYRDIVRRAWEQVEKAATPEVRGQLFSEGLEWTMLDEEFQERTGRAFGDEPVYVPPWWGRYRPWIATMPPSGTAQPSAPSQPAAPSQPIRLPHLPGSDFAARMVRGVEGTAGR
ncbi:MAG: hypothetical protein ACP5SI_05860, partial [Chloroflexia bacterium]